MKERWFLKCRSCKQPWAIEITDIIKTCQGPTKRPELNRAESGPCPLCGYTPDRSQFHGRMGKVRRKYLAQMHFQPPCDGRCTNAKGPNCDCQCNGANHGSQRLIECEAYAGRIPECAP